MKTDYTRQMVRVTHRENGKLTTVTLEHPLYIQACRMLRSTGTVNGLIYRLELKTPLTECKTLSGAVSDALERHLHAFKHSR